MHMSNDISIIFPSPIHMAWDPIKSSGWMLGILASLPFHLSDETPSLFNYDCESCSAGILGRDFYRVWFWKFFFNLPWIGLRENLQENPIFHGKIYGFQSRFSLKPIHSNMGVSEKWLVYSNL